jgi:hypothetical protein
VSGEEREDGVIQLLFHWSQLSGELTSDINVHFYRVGQSVEVAFFTIPQEDTRIAEVIRTYRDQMPVISLPSTFLEPTVSLDDRREMFREALFKAAAD